MGGLRWTPRQRKWQVGRESGGVEPSRIDVNGRAPTSLEYPSTTIEAIYTSYAVASVALMRFSPREMSTASRKNIAVNRLLYKCTGVHVLDLVLPTVHSGYVGDRRDRLKWGADIGV